VPTAAAQPRQLALETPLGPGTLTLVGLTGREAVSQLFAFDLDLVARAAAVPFDQLVGQPMTASVGAGRYFNGLVSRFSAGGSARSPAYRATLVPALWLLTRRAGSRVFQDISVPDIVRQVLDGAGLSATFELQRSYLPRNYCVQYRESDFDFVSRLLEEEGISYSFRHGSGSHELVLGDDSTAAVDAGTFPFDEKPGKVDPPRVLAWEKTQELTSGRVTLRDHHFELPHSTLEGTATILPAVQAGRVTHQLQLAGNEGFELYDYPGGYAERFDGVGPSGEDRPQDLARLVEAPARAASLRMEEEASRALGVAATSTCRALAPGLGFGVSGHFDADGRYYITGVQHSASQPDGAEGDGGFVYQNQVRGIPGTLPFRPPRATLQPVVGGTDSAVVVGPAGERTFVDRFGRVKVQFHWDREGRSDERSSCWIRVAQPVGGNGAAMFWIPEVGDEVLVAFEHGDPDRPYVVGRLFDRDDRPPDDR
jgi:type VI secretion system secreted protein VgrG